MNMDSISSARAMADWRSKVEAVAATIHGQGEFEHRKGEAVIQTSKEIAELREFVVNRDKLESKVATRRFMITTILSIAVLVVAIIGILIQVYIAFNAEGFKKEGESDKCDENSLERNACASLPPPNTKSNP